MLAAATSLPQLAAQDAGIVHMMQTLPFVPVVAGGLRAPGQLYDPRCARQENSLAPPNRSSLNLRNL